MEGWVDLVRALPLGGGYNYDSTSIRRSFDARLSVYQRSLSALWRSPLAAVTLIYLAYCI